MKKLRSEGRNERRRDERNGDSDVSMVKLQIECRRRSNSIRGGS